MISFLRKGAGDEREFDRRGLLCLGVLAGMERFMYFTS